MVVRQGTDVFPVLSKTARDLALADERPAARMADAILRYGITAAALGLRRR
jgi:hypothetical protein